MVLCCLKQVVSDSDPDFFERFFLYVEDPNNATLHLTVRTLHECGLLPKYSCTGGA
jgi:hypothetical protein